MVYREQTNAQAHNYFYGFKKNINVAIADPPKTPGVHKLKAELKGA